MCLLGLFMTDVASYDLREMRWDGCGSLEEDGMTGAEKKGDWREWGVRTVEKGELRQAVD